MGLSQDEKKPRRAGFRKKKQGPASLADACWRAIPLEDGLSPGQTGVSVRALRPNGHNAWQGSKTRLPDEDFKVEYKDPQLYAAGKQIFISSQTMNNLGWEMTQHGDMSSIPRTHTKN